MARGYHERVIEPTRTPKHAAQWIASLENHVPAALWHAPLGEVTAPLLLSALLDVAPHERARNLEGDTLPETVRRIRQRLEAVHGPLEVELQLEAPRALLGAAVRRFARRHAASVAA